MPRCVGLWLRADGHVRAHGRSARRADLRVSEELLPKCGGSHDRPCDVREGRAGRSLFRGGSGGAPLDVSVLDLCDELGLWVWQELPVHNMKNSAVGLQVTNDLIAALRGFARVDQIKLDEPMARHTTFRVGGAADVFFMP